jgi:Flp pilus assembly pilin Flp
MRLRRDQRGSSAVELALVLPLFFLVIVGVLSLLWMLSARTAISGAARDAARYASIRHDPLTCAPDPCVHDWPTEEEVEIYARERAGRFGVDRVTVSRPSQTNMPVSVTVERELPTLFRAFGALFGAESLEYSSTAKARAE